MRLLFPGVCVPVQQDSTSGHMDEMLKCLCRPANRDAMDSREDQDYAHEHRNPRKRGFARAGYGRVSLEYPGNEYLHFALITPESPQHRAFAPGCEHSLLLAWLREGAAAAINERDSTRSRA